MTTSSDGAFSFQPNKYGAPCFYCARRVHKGKGCCWPSPLLGGRYAAGHTDCVAAAIADGTAPLVGSSNETREAMGLAPHVDVASHARTLKGIRDALKVVRLDSPAGDIVAAVEAVRALLSRCPSPDADGTAGVPF